jgi:hypothetical protein
LISFRHTHSDEAPFVMSHIFPQVSGPSLSIWAIFLSIPLKVDILPSEGATAFIAKLLMDLKKTFKHFWNS